MSYNIGWGDDDLGCYYQTPEQTKKWYAKWNGDTGNYYAYVVRIEDDIPVGEVSIHWDNTLKKHIAEVIIEAKYRGNGYSKEALSLLVENAFIRLKIESLADNFPGSRISAEKIYTHVGFTRTSDELVELTREQFFKM